MKRIGILSDTHSCWDDRFAQHFAGCDEIWHAGDIGWIGVIRRLESVAPIVRAVRGNIDSGEVRRAFPELAEFEVEGCRVLLTHIGGYPGHYAPGIQSRLLRSQTNIFVCGHSHILKVMYDDGLKCLHINPGAAGHHGWHKKRTLARFVIDEGIPRDMEIIELAGNC